MVELVKRYPENFFCWIDLESTDAEGARQFYSTVFGWEFRNIGKEENYYQAEHVGFAVCGLSQSNISTTRWHSYIHTADAAALAESARDLGSPETGDVKQLGDLARIAEITDPTGGAFRVWEPINHIGAHIVNEPQSWIWNHLFTHNVDVAEQFYADLFGWTSEIEASLEDNQTYFRLGDRLIAGMVRMSPKYFPESTSSFWSICIRVHDCDAAADLARSAGGGVLIEPRNIPNVGRLATIVDPQGGRFQILKTNIYDPPPH